MLSRLKIRLISFLGILVLGQSFINRHNPSRVVPKSSKATLLNNGAKFVVSSESKSDVTKRQWTSALSMKRGAKGGNDKSKEMADKNTDKDSNSKNVESEKVDLFYIQEPTLLVGDLVSLLLTCQLLGLVDVLSTQEFWNNGGFAQPVDLSPSGLSSLETLVKRDSLMSIAWVLSSIRNRGYFISSVLDDMTAIKCAFTIFIDYCSLLIILTLVFAFGLSKTAIF